jgi:DNA-binding IclR family transcriptional regulator
VGFPIGHRSGSLIGAISAAGPIQRVDDRKLDELKVQLLKAAREISQGLM